MCVRRDRAWGELVEWGQKARNNENCRKAERRFQAYARQPAVDQTPVGGMYHRYSTPGLRSSAKVPGKEVHPRLPFSRNLRTRRREDGGAVRKGRAKGNIVFGVVT